jgi:diaminohydroxyphosphoribosylaminopyrimidine deaminase/5-amino-6-(5-phosphoribosylamino)uracil reductase
MTPRQNDSKWMRIAIEQARLCPATQGAYSVGAVIVDSFEKEIARGYSRETDGKVHAEESALAKVSEPDRRRLVGATIYSTLEPCSQRASRPLSCTHLILGAGIPRVVIAWREPSLFVADGQGVELLERAGVQVVELDALAAEAKAMNAHLAID